MNLLIAIALCCAEPHVEETYEAVVHICTTIEVDGRVLRIPHLFFRRDKKLYIAYCQPEDIFWAADERGPVAYFRDTFHNCERVVHFSSIEQYELPEPEWEEMKKPE